ncbi:MAG: hypothetical protein ABMA15_09275 [Vicinamibacterales bacterium]
MTKQISAAGGAALIVLLAISLTNDGLLAQRGTPPPTPAPRPAAPRPAAQAASGYNGPRTPDRKPDLNGIWQVLGTAHWNLEAHSATEGVPAGFSVVEGGTIPYQPAALAKRNENFQNRLMADPIRKCYMPGVPRATYMPFPFEITQTPKHIGIAYEFAHATRTIFMDGTPHMDDLDFWMGDGRGKWEGDTLVIDTVSLGDQTWFDQAGNFHSDALKVVERFTPTDATHINYEVTFDDAKVFTRPWKMNMTIYRRVEKNLELLDYECIEHVYQKVFKPAAGKP